MIHSFTTKNFYSIGDEVSVDFTVNDNAPAKDSYMESANGIRVSLVESIIGPNASGKTNVLKTLAFMEWLVHKAFTDDPDRPIPVRPFGHKNDKPRPTLLSVTFSIDDRLFIYDFELIRERILKEVLTERSKAKERVTNKLLFSRKWNTGEKKYDFTDKVFGVSADKLRKNSTVIATAYRDNHPLATLIAQYWRDRLITNVRERGYENHDHIMHDHLASHAIEFFYEDPELRERVESLLSKYDIGFGAFVKHQNELQDRAIFGIEHKFSSGTFELPLQYESSGTKQAIIILRHILTALANGGMAVIDELDANLHPEIVEELISMFSSKELNPLSAQILFSSHTPTILATLDKYQITFVEKNDAGQTEVWRLDSIRGVRPDDNYYAKYIAGAYGALPELG